MNNNRVVHVANQLVSALILSAISIFYATGSPAQTLTVLHSFDLTDGFANYTNAQLVQGANGELYGTTSIGGAHGAGTVFSIATSGALTTLYNFCSQAGCTDGSQPIAGLTLATDGNFYGTTESGGAYSQGTLFKITPNGALTTLYSFCSQGTGFCADGRNPSGALIQATDGNLYGTTSAGGTPGGGTVFRITTGGALTTLYSFCSQPGCTDGASPEAGLIQGSDGNFYGTTDTAGQSGSADSLGGTVFKITPAGTFTVLYGFPYCANAGECPSGEGPESGSLLQANDGNLYGTTELGGSGEAGVIFELTTAGTFSVVWNDYSLPHDADGAFPGHLIQGSDGNIYGVTHEGGYDPTYPSYGQGGTIFELNAGGLSPLYTFIGTPAGESYPYAQFLQGDLPTYGGLIQATDGNFYGMTQNGGASAAVPYAQGYGTVFQFSTGLGPLVQTQTQAGLVGETVSIFGTDLAGATGVTFNGTPAALTVASPTEILTRVPAGATTGIVRVVTPSGPLSTSAAYTVQTPPATPVFTPDRAAQTVAISDATPGATIYYTLDGSTPTLSSPRYSKPVSIGTSSTLSAIALAPNDTLSAVTTYGSDSKKATRTQLTSNPSSAEFGSPIKLEAVVKQSDETSAPTGTVTFMDGSATLGAAALNGSGIALLTSRTLPLGSDSITAVYSGDATGQPSTSSAITVTISPPGKPTVTYLSATPTSANAGTAIKFEAVVKQSDETSVPTGTVSFMDGSTTVGSATLNASGIALFSTKALPAGTDSITAVYQGDSVDKPSTSSAVTVTIN